MHSVVGLAWLVVHTVRKLRTNVGAKISLVACRRQPFGFFSVGTLPALHVASDRARSRTLPLLPTALAPGSAFPSI
jgi:hypothetical protein